VVLTLAFTFALAVPLELDTPWAIALLLAPLAIATSQLAISLVNRMATLLVAPLPLPRMDFADGIPPANRTLVVVPSMLTSPAAVPALVDGLEVRALANRDDGLFFALLTDFTDAHAEHRPDDEALLEAAVRGIETLNQRHDDVRFLLFHRPRRWNPVERIWMG